jgi:hypothetical protein
MTFGYADKLSYREDLGGSLGDPEYTDSEEELQIKIEQLAALVRTPQRQPSACFLAATTLLKVHAPEPQTPELGSIHSASQVKNSQRIAAFTGAGISKAAGVL